MQQLLGFCMDALPRGRMDPVPPLGARWTVVLLGILIAQQEKKNVNSFGFI